MKFVSVQVLDLYISFSPSKGVVNEDVKNIIMNNTLG